MPTFTVEDGTGITGANSYASVQEADDYLSVNTKAYGVWTDSSDREAYLMWATRLLDQRTRWAGTKVVREGSLAWPRMYVVDREGFAVPHNEVPYPVKEATIEIAYYLLSQGIDPSIGVTGTTGNMKRIKLDVLELEYQADTSSAATSVFPKGLNRILAPLGFISISGQGNAVPIIRV